MEVQGKLTAESLAQYYEHWMKNVGPHRNEEDLRFGQWLWSLYNQQLREAREKVEGAERNLDGFYTESPSTAYSQILKLITL